MRDAFYASDGFVECVGLTSKEGVSVVACVFCVRGAYRDVGRVGWRLTSAISSTITYSNSPTPSNSFFKYSPFSVERTVPRTLWPLQSSVEHRCDALGGWLGEVRYGRGRGAYR